MANFTDVHDGISDVNGKNNSGLLREGLVAALVGAGVLGGGISCSSSEVVLENNVSGIEYTSSVEKGYLKLKVEFENAGERLVPYRQRMKDLQGEIDTITAGIKHETNKPKEKWDADKLAGYKSSLERITANNSKNMQKLAPDLIDHYNISIQWYETIISKAEHDARSIENRIDELGKMQNGGETHATNYTGSAINPSVYELNLKELNIIERSLLDHSTAFASIRDNTTDIVSRAGLEEYGDRLKELRKQHDDLDAKAKKVRDYISTVRNKSSEIKPASAEDTTKVDGDKVVGDVSEWNEWDSRTPNITIHPAKPASPTTAPTRDPWETDDTQRIYTKDELDAAVREVHTRYDESINRIVANAVSDAQRDASKSLEAYKGELNKVRKELKNLQIEYAASKRQATELEEQAKKENIDGLSKELDKVREQNQQYSARINELEKKIAQMGSGADISRLLERLRGEGSSGAPAVSVIDKLIDTYSEKGYTITPNNGGIFEVAKVQAIKGLEFEFIGKYDAQGRFTGLSVRHEGNVFEKLEDMGSVNADILNALRPRYDVMRNYFIVNAPR